MILSFAHRYIFVRGRKVGGTSVEIALSTLCGPDDIVSPLIGVDERHRQALNGRCGNYSDQPDLEVAYAALVRNVPFDKLHLLHKPPAKYSAHSSLAQIVAAHPKPLDDFQVVLIARCPYARVFSALNMGPTFSAYRRGGLMRSQPQLWAGAFDRALGSGALRLWRNMPLYRDPKEERQAHVIRYERLQEDFDAFVGGLEKGRRIALPHAKKGLLSNRFSPSKFLRRDQIDTINEIFSDEFEAFGYAPL